MKESERYALVGEMMKLPEADRNFALGYAAGVLAKASEAKKPQKPTREKKPA